VTGPRGAPPSDIPAFLARVHTYCQPDTPLAVGFGMSTPQHVTQHCAVGPMLWWWDLSPSTRYSATSTLPPPSIARTGLKMRTRVHRQTPPSAGSSRSTAGSLMEGYVEPLVSLVPLLCVYLRVHVSYPPPLPPLCHLFFYFPSHTAPAALLRRDPHETDLGRYVWLKERRSLTLAHTRSTTPWVRCIAYLLYTISYYIIETLPPPLPSPSLHRGMGSAVQATPQDARHMRNRCWAARGRHGCSACPVWTDFYYFIEGNIPSITVLPPT